MCLSVDEWRSRFPSGTASERQQFAHELVGHVTTLHEAGKLTADFLQIAVGSLGQAVELDGLFTAMATEALKCLEAQAIRVSPGQAVLA